MNRYFNEQSTIFISGASSGIGKCLATLLVKKYACKVLGSARSQTKLAALKEELGENFNFFVMDVGLETEWERLAKYLESNCVKLSGVINCAGVLPRFSLFSGSYFDENKDVISVNYLSVLYSAKYTLPIIEKENNPIMINVSSSSALCPFAAVSLYSSTKAAVERFSECLSVENKKIKVITVMPGFTKTEVMKNQTLLTKEKRLIDGISANPNKVAKKILQKASRGKKRIVTGFDAHLMNFLFKFFPRTAPRLIGWFLKKTKMKMFENI